MALIEEGQVVKGAEVCDKVHGESLGRFCYG